MIGALNGIPLAIDSGVLSLACGEITYEVNVNGNWRTWPENDCSEMLWTHVDYPEKGPPSMWGFREKGERDTFRRLIKIDNVGCKVAMRIVGAKAVMFNPLEGAPEYTAVPATLRAVRGIGPKLYERIIVELSK